MADFTIIAFYEYTDFDSEPDGNPDGTWVPSPDPLTILPAPLVYGDTDTTFVLGEDVNAPNGNTFMGYVTIDGVDFAVVTGEGGDLYTPTILIPEGIDPNSVNFPSLINLNDPNDPTEFSDTAFAHCFGEGTRIATTEGEVPVEALTRAHRVLTADGRAEPVMFVGWQEIGTRMPTRSSVSFIRIAAGALGQGLPMRDLVVTGDHAMMIDGVLVTAAALVDGQCIRHLTRDEMKPVMRVYHVETRGHEVLLAEGAPSESFVDYMGRRRFGNYGEYLEVHGAGRLIREMDAPRVTAARMLPHAIRARLDAVAGHDRQTDRAEAA